MSINLNQTISVLTPVLRQTCTLTSGIMFVWPALKGSNKNLSLWRLTNRCLVFTSKRLKLQLRSLDLKLKIKADRTRVCP